MERKNPVKLSTQIKRRINNPEPEKLLYEPFGGNFKRVISIGSTLLNLAISGGEVYGGGLPGGIFVEISGPESSGKTVILCEIAGAIQRAGGENLFNDPEARLNKKFATMFGFDTNTMTYLTPNTVTEVFVGARNWKPKNIGNDTVNGIFADSLAALSTDLEMDNEKGDKMGGRRGKEFSEQLRKTCRLLKDNNYLMVASNQLRDTFNTFGPSVDSPGGWALKFYASLRLRITKSSKLIAKKTFRGKEISEVIGVRSTIEVIKSSLWKPFRKAPLTIIFDYGVDDIRENLQFVKDFTKSPVYTLNGSKLDNSMEKSIRIIENNNSEEELKKQTINLWTEIDSRFNSNRKIKQRT